MDTLQAAGAEDKPLLGSKLSADSGANLVIDFSEGLHVALVSQPRTRQRARSRWKEEARPLSFSSKLPSEPSIEHSRRLLHFASVAQALREHLNGFVAVWEVDAHSIATSLPDWSEMCL